MIRIQFNGSPASYTVDFQSTDDAVVLIGDKFPKKMDKGFKAYRLNGVFLGDYSDYTKATPIEGGFAFERKV